MTTEPTDLERNEELIAAAQIRLDHEAVKRVTDIADEMEKWLGFVTNEQRLELLELAVTLVINSPQR